MHVIKAALRRLTRHLRVGRPRPDRIDPGTQRALNELWNEYGEAVLIAVLRECGAPSHVTAYVESLTPDWNAHYETHREEIDREQTRARQEAERLLRRHLRRDERRLRPVIVRRTGGRVRARARARRDRRATPRPSSARSPGREPEPPARSAEGAA